MDEQEKAFVVAAIKVKMADDRKKEKEMIFRLVDGMSDLFLPQYVSAAPLTAPKPADLPSCINTNITSAIQIRIKI